MLHLFPSCCPSNQSARHLLPASGCCHMHWGLRYSESPSKVTCRSSPESQQICVGHTAASCPSFVGDWRSGSSDNITFGFIHCALRMLQLYANWLTSTWFSSNTGPSTTTPPAFYQSQYHRRLTLHLHILWVQPLYLKISHGNSWICSFNLLILICSR